MATVKLLTITIEYLWHATYLYDGSHHAVAQMSPTGICNASLKSPCHPSPQKTQFVARVARQQDVLRLAPCAADAKVGQDRHHGGTSSGHARELQAVSSRVQHGHRLVSSRHVPIAHGLKKKQAILNQK